MLLECTVLQQICDEYYTAESLRTLFETIPEACIVEFLREAGFFYLIWQAIHSIQHIRITHQLTKFGSYINHHTLTTPLHSVIRLQSINIWENPTCERGLICLWGCVSSLNKCNQPCQSQEPRSYVSLVPLIRVYAQETHVAHCCLLKSLLDKRGVTLVMTPHCNAKKKQNTPMITLPKSPNVQETNHEPLTD